jgi:alpha-L-arabinofuranosidase
VEKDGETLYESNFAVDAADWQPEGNRQRGGGSRNWRVEDGVYRQDRTGYAMSYIGDEGWSDYTLTLKARKGDGNEGFLIAFGRRGGDRFWWNLGGWGNSQHAIELNQTPVGRPVRGRIESNRWYDIKVELTGNRIRCYLDGELIHDATSTPPEKFFAVAGRDDSSNELVIKAINVSSEPLKSDVQIDGSIATGRKASAIVLTSATLDDNNTLEMPHRVVPKTFDVDTASSPLEHEFPPYSLTILRLSLND